MSETLVEKIRALRAVRPIGVARCREVLADGRTFEQALAAIDAECIAELMARVGVDEKRAELALSRGGWDVERVCLEIAREEQQVELERSGALARAREGLSAEEIPPFEGLGELDAGSSLDLARVRTALLRLGARLGDPRALERHLERNWSTLWYREFLAPLLSHGCLASYLRNCPLQESVRVDGCDVTLLGLPDLAQSGWPADRVGEAGWLLIATDEADGYCMRPDRAEVFFCSHEAGPLADPRLPPDEIYAEVEIRFASLPDLLESLVRAPSTRGFARWQNPRPDSQLQCLAERVCTAAEDDLNPTQLKLRAVFDLLRQGFVEFIEMRHQGETAAAIDGLRAVGALDGARLVAEAASAKVPDPRPRQRLDPEIVDLYRQRASRGDQLAQWHLEDLDHAMVFDRARLIALTARFEAELDAIETRLSTFVESDPESWNA